MKIFNTLSRRKRSLCRSNRARLRCMCADRPFTNFIHIGNARPMIVFDTVTRYFEYKGYEVNYVSNFTDVDDKIIRKAIEEGVDAETISKRYIAECKRYGDDERQTGDEESAGDSGDRRYDRDDQYADRKRTCVCGS